EDGIRDGHVTGVQTCALPISTARVANSRRTASAALSLQVRTTPEADSQIREIDNWWRRNRAASPNLFVDELAAAFDILAHAPHIGRLYRQSPVPDTRRLLLMETRYQIGRAHV